MDLRITLPAAARPLCPTCSAELVIRLHGLSRCIVCPGCGRVFSRETSTGKLSELRRYHIRNFIPYLVPGDSGELFGRRYLVTGWVQKKEKGTSFKWVEYHLFNPVHGFAQLSVFDGHWTFHEQLSVYPLDVNINGILVFDRRAYEPYNSYSCIVLEAAGEFTRDVNDDQRAKLRELISPPYMLTRESDPDELAWYLGQYVEPAVVKKGFAKTKEPPLRSGIGAAQPMKLAIEKDVLRTISIAAVAVLVLTQILLGISSGPYTVQEQSYATGLDTAGSYLEVEGPPFTLSDHLSAVELRVAPRDLDNNWFEVGGALVNEGTGEVRSFNFNIEYYHGYEGGERWSEGGTKDGIVFSALPAGTYHLKFQPAFDRSRPVGGFVASVDVDPMLWSNMWLMLALALAFPLLTWYRVSNFEANRWGD